MLRKQAIQKQKGSLDIKIEQSLNEKEKLILFREISKYFKKELNIYIYDGQVLRRKTEKLKDFIPLKE